jgi:hypothetical protein
MPRVCSPLNRHSKTWEGKLSFTNSLLLLVVDRWSDLKSYPQ